MKFFSTSVCLLLLLIFRGISFSQVYNRPVPADLFSYEYVQQDTMNRGCILAGLFKINVVPNSPNFKSPYPAIFDNDGYLLWYSKPTVGNLLNFQFHPTTKQYSYTQVAQNQIRFVVLDSNLNVTHMHQDQNGLEDVHEFLLAANGNWLFMTQSYDTVDLSSQIFGGNPGSTQTVLLGIGVQEIDPSGNIVFEWDANDHLDPLDSYPFYGYNANNYDYCHGNAIAEDDDGNLLVSQRHLNAIYKINRYTGDVIWKLGGQSSDFTFTNDNGFSGQHDIRKLPNGNYSLFDNGNMSMPITTRGVEYSLDTVSWTATRIHQVVHPTNTPSNAMGSYRKLANGDHLLGYGLIYQPSASATLFDANDVISRAFYFEDSVMSYRFTHAESLPISRPTISCQNTISGLQLSGPAGANSYLWSTGETTASIIVQSADTIQLWVPFGSGFVGSKPYTVNDPLSPCQLSLEELMVAQAGRSFKIVNLLGQEVKTVEAQKLYLKQWDNGSVEKFIQGEF